MSQEREDEHIIAKSMDAIMFAAFEAGFDASGEGENGEYIHPSMRGEPIQRKLREKFDEWLRERERS